MFAAASVFALASIASCWTVKQANGISHGKHKLHGETGMIGPHDRQEHDPLDAIQLPDVPTSPHNTAKSLQEYLDQLCNSMFKEICMKGTKRFCNKTTVARKPFAAAPGSEYGGFRCYDDNVLEHGESSALCIDDCGNELKCRGNPKPEAALEIPHGDKLQVAMAAGRAKFCNAFQDYSDSYCNELRGGSIARMATDPAKGGPTALRCFPKDSIDFHKPGICYDNCGIPRACAGGVLTGEESKSVTSVPPLAELKNPCGDGTCYPTLEESPICVPKGTTKPSLGYPSVPFRPPMSVDPSLSSYMRHIREMRPSSLQEFLNAGCRAIYIDLCKKGLAHFCDPLAVARKDRGIKETQSNFEWRCYDVGMLSNNTEGYCVDDCANEIKCQGGIEDTSMGHTTVPRLIKSLIKFGRGIYCSQQQEYINNICKTSDPESVARKAVAMKGESPKWGCFPKSSLRFDKLGICVNNCSREYRCHGDFEQGVTLKSSPKLPNPIDMPTRCKVGMCEPILDNNPVCHYSVLATGYEFYQTPEDTRPSSLQGFLDEVCTKILGKYCKTGKNEFCGAKGVARYERGSSSPLLQWRCFKAETLAMGEVHARCVDDCGHQFPCSGGYGSGTVYQSGVDSLLESLIGSAVLFYCSTDQRRMNQICRRTNPGSVARGTGSGWVCVDPRFIDLSTKGTCYNNCGEEAPCSGGIKSSAQTQAINPESRAVPKNPCGRMKCVPTRDFSPLCQSAE